MAAHEQGKTLKVGVVGEERAYFHSTLHGGTDKAFKVEEDLEGQRSGGLQSCKEAG
jgi:hypothetical protein